MAEQEVNQLVDQIKKIAATADETARRNISSTLRQLTVEVESPGETVHRILYPLLLQSVCVVANDLNLFEILSNNHGPMTTEELAEKTKCDPVLMGRLLRFLASTYTIIETGEDAFKANNVTKTFTKPGLRAGLNHCFYTVNPGLQALPEFLKATEYQNPESSDNTAFQKGHKTDLSPFEWFKTKPKNVGWFMEFMPAQREGMPIWLDAFPEPKGVDPERVLFVDVGGGIGHQGVELKTRYPSLTGRFILQDLPEPLESALPGVEPLAHDFFTPQPVNCKGAKFYYMRNILHDWPDDRCRTILSHLRDAMGPDSFVLIDEMVLPNESASLSAMQLDMIMMASASSMERTEQQWIDLLDSVGLEIAHTYVYTESLKDSILACVPMK